MKAERDKRAAILVAEGERQAAILTAEGAKQAQILAAEGRREAAYRDAEARERSAEAEAKATQWSATRSAKGNVQAINYFVANNYIGALKALAEAKNQKVLILPIEATSVIGAIAGVAEIAREAFGDRGGNSASPPARQAAARRRRACVPAARFLPSRKLATRWKRSLHARPLDLDDPRRDPVRARGHVARHFPDVVRHGRGCHRAHRVRASTSAGSGSSCGSACSRSPPCCSRCKYLRRQSIAKRPAAAQ